MYSIAKIEQFMTRNDHGSLAKMKNKVMDQKVITGSFLLEM